MSYECVTLVLVENKKRKRDCNTPLDNNGTNN